METEKKQDSRLLLRRFLSVALLVSVVFGICAAVVELEFIDEEISSQAFQEGQQLFRYVNEVTLNEGISTKEALRRYQEGASNDNRNRFIMAELYDASGHEVGKISEIAENSPLNEASKHDKAFLDEENVRWYRKFYDNGHIYFQTITKVEDKRNQALLSSNLQMLKVLGNAVAKRDNDTYEHNYRVTLYSIYLAQQAKVNQSTMRAVIKGALLHDIGKIAISDTILLKPGKLTDEEFEVMKEHVDHGKDIVDGIHWLQDADKIISGHHEKFNGSGYPLGIKGDSIPIEARIFALSDVFDALTSKRPYKAPFTIEKSLAIMEEGVNSHFDPDLFNLFKANIKRWHAEICEKDIQVLEEHLQTYFKRYFNFASN